MFCSACVNCAMRCALFSRGLVCIDRRRIQHAGRGRCGAGPGSSSERFLDTPLKHYSSGMQLRLAFAVAAFLEPEILIIDEVLAVGDAEFQRKCMGKMEDASKSGRNAFVTGKSGEKVVPAT